MCFSRKNKISTKEQYYNELYTLHRKGERICSQSVHDLEKARRRVMQVFKFFKISFPPEAEVLDVGCGLGCYSEAFNKFGFRVVGIDASNVAIELACKKFIGPQFECAHYPEDINDYFDLIWAVDLSTINTFDTNLISLFIAESLQRLKPNGILIIGWHTDFSGKIKDDWAHWDLSTLRNVRKIKGLYGPAIVQTRYKLLNRIGIYICRVIEKSTPIFLVIRT